MEQDIKKDFIWNTTGSALYALAAAVLALAALRLAGPDDGGIFGFGYSTIGQQLFIVAYFGLRPFHITDTMRRYTYADYRELRRLSACGAFILGIVFLLLMKALRGYTLRKCSVLTILIAIKITDGVADLYESECQRIGRLYIAGMEIALRTVLMCLVMIAALFISGDILIASAVALLSEIIVAAGYKILLERRLLPEISPEVSPCAGVRALVADTGLIFLSVFLDFYVFSASKYAVDLYMTDADNGIFNLLFMPTSVIYLLANFVIRPFLSRLSKLSDAGDMDIFSDEVKRLFIVIAAIGIACFLGSCLLGGPVLYIGELILGAGYSGALTARSLVFSLVILGGAFYALSCLYYYVLVILRKQRDIFVSYLAMVVIGALVSLISVRRFGLVGAGAGYAAYMFIMMLIFAFRVRAAIKAAKG